MDNISCISSFFCTFVYSKPHTKPSGDPLHMQHNVLSQVVWLFLISVILLLILSLLPPVNIGNYTTKQIDLLSDLRSPDENPNLTECPNSSFIANTDPNADSRQAGNPETTNANNESPAQTSIKTDSVPHRDGDIILIEDYTPQSDGLNYFSKAIKQAHSIGRPVRIAFLGDSFIEADIFTQNVREAMQTLYGGCGVGYMGMHSEFPGFRRSITQTDNGWQTHSVITRPEIVKTSLPLQIYRPGRKAFTRLKGVKKLSHLDKWDTSHIIFIAEQTAQFTLKTDSAQHIYDIFPSEQAQIITINEPTSLLEIRCDSTDGIAVWGVWLDGRQGIAIDNISMRGYSGSTITNIPEQRLKELNDMIPYDMIVLQYGLNRITPSITRYDSFTEELTLIVNHLQESIPGAAILIMGIGDRCQNQNGEMQTMKAVYGMTNAQRQAARISGCLFWDTCEAMKNLGGMTYFVEQKWANKDYTHISHAGGKPLANEFVKALEYAINNNTSTATHTEQNE